MLHFVVARWNLSPFCTLPQDTEVFFDLKKLLEESKAVVPPQLASHEAARIKPGGVGERRRDQTVYARTD